MTSPLNIFLADLTHNPERTNVHNMPLGIGNLCSYLSHNLEDQIRVKLFRYGEDLESALKANPPQVAMFSNYIWNERLTGAWAERIKETDPSILVVFGGPNFPLDASRQAEFLKRYREIDIYLRYEGEKAALHLVRKYLSLDKDIRALKRTELPNASLLDDRGELVSFPELPRLKDLDEIPSPWLNGHMDVFFDGKLYPTIQTNRGCPFSCTFCNSGVSGLNKIRNHSVARVTADIEYIAEKIQQTCPLITSMTLADDNFAMYKRDLEIAQVIRDVNATYGFPRLISCTTGKNQKERVLETISLLENIIPVMASMQSLNPTTLKAVARDNIRLSDYMAVQEEISKRDITSVSDLILPLPEETLASFYDGIRSLMKVRMQTINMFQLLMAMGSVMETDAHREKYRLKTKFRIAASSFSRVGRKLVFDMEESVVATSTMSEEEFYKGREMQFWVIVFYEGPSYNFLQNLLEQYGIPYFDYLQHLQDRKREAPRPVQELVDGYCRESRQELFDSYEDLSAFYSQPDHLEDLLTAKIGNSLLRKYLALAHLVHWRATTAFAKDEAFSLLADRLTPVMRKEIETIFEYLEGVSIHTDGLNHIRRTVEKDLPFNVKAWADDGCVRPLHQYVAAYGFRFTWRIAPKHYDHFKRLVTGHSEDLVGQIKIVFHTKAAYFFRNLERVEEIMSASELSA